MKSLPRAGFAAILAGPPGTGKTAAALELARDRLGGDPETHPDYAALRAPPKKSDIPVEEVREARRQLYLRPARAAVRVLHVADGNALNDEGQNTLLKTFEEPPPYAILLLECSRPDRLLTTVRSRCRMIRFAPLSVAEIAARVGNPHAAALADGSLSRAQALASAWDALQPDRLPDPRSELWKSRDDARWALALWGRAVVGALGGSAPWLAPGELDSLVALGPDRLADLLDRITHAQTLLERNVNPALLVDLIGHWSAP